MKKKQTEKSLFLLFCSWYSFIRFMFAVNEWKQMHCASSDLHCAMCSSIWKKMKCLGTMFKRHGKAENNLLFTHIHFLNLYNTEELAKITDYDVMYVPTEDMELQWKYERKHCQPTTFTSHHCESTIVPWFETQQITLDGCIVIML